MCSSVAEHFFYTEACGGSSPLTPTQIERKLQMILIGGNHLTQRLPIAKWLQHLSYIQAIASSTLARQTDLTNYINGV